MSELKNVQVGDKVVFSSQFYGDCIKIVEAITPKGFIKVDGRLYNKDGRMRGGDTWSAYIYAATPEIMQKLRANNFIKMVLNKMHQTTNIDYVQALEISRILEGRKNETD